MKILTFTILISSCNYVKIFSLIEMVHQQLQGIAKNKKSVGNTSRNKVVQPFLKSANINKEQSSNKEVVVKKERRTTTISAQPVIPKYTFHIYLKII